MDQRRQKIALISVYDKEGIIDFARSLIDLGWKIISSGGTAKHLNEAGIKTTDVAEITEMPSILSHRVVTLHYKIHGGLMALNTPEHLAEMKKYGIPWIDMVCDDLYPLEKEISNQNATRESVIEKTDIGGPTLIRSATKGRRITICDVADRNLVLDWLKNGEPEREEFINNLAAKAEAIISRYYAISGDYHSNGKYKGIFGEKTLQCAYGENAYQAPASLYKNPLSRSNLDNQDKLAISNWELIAGGPMSYNNFCDLDRMIQTMTHLGAGFEKNFKTIPNIAIGVKHGNPCGAGVGDSELETVAKMLQGDLRAIFGGSIMLNFKVDENIAEELIHKHMKEGRRLLDIVAAPEFTPEAIEILARKKGKCRILVNPNIKKAGLNSLDISKRFRYVRGGFLEQPNYTFVPDLGRTVLPDQGGLSSLKLDLVSAWGIGSTSNSNTITLVKDGRLFGNGVGQQDRVGAAKLAIFRADDAAVFANLATEPPSGGSVAKTTANLENAVAYSDSFFPFPDAVAVLLDRGIKTIFSTSGSVNDEKIIALCKSRGVNLILIPDKEARGFYQH